MAGLRPTVQQLAMVLGLVVVDWWVVQRRTAALQPELGQGEQQPKAVLQPQERAPVVQ